MEEIKSVTLRAIFARAQTTVDGGWRISLDVSDQEAEAVMRLAELRDTVLQVAFVPIPESGAL